MSWVARRTPLLLRQSHCEEFRDEKACFGLDWTVPGHGGICAGGCLLPRRRARLAGGDHRCWGAVIERSEYEPYGELLNRPLADGPGYTGHVSDQETGLSYMQQRYYDPSLGEFLSVDPVTPQGAPLLAFNRYRYANGNPCRFTDPDGRLAWFAPMITGAFFGGAAGLKERSKQ